VPARVGPTTPKRPPGLPLALWPLDRLTCVRAFPLLNECHPESVNAYRAGPEIEVSRYVLALTPACDMMNRRVHRGIGPMGVTYDQADVCSVREEILGR
jgi:hypothetical protein